jgi:hypothetical protein
MYAYTGFGDFPYKLPTKKINSPEELFAGWMLLSYNKPVEVSSELAGHPKAYAADEEIRSYWSAQTGNKGEWISMDLQKLSTVNAVQINYAENNMNLFGRGDGIYYQYLLEYSTDNKTWKTLADKTQNTIDASHDYIELKTPVKARYIRLTNHRMPSGTFALAGLRVFGNDGGKAPAVAENLNVERQSDRAIVKLNWKGLPDAVGYNIRFGTAKDKLYHTYQVLGKESLSIHSLNTAHKYYFTVDAFNESGVKKGTKIIEVN